MQNGRSQDAQPIPETVALKSKFPKNNNSVEYKIGIGDKLTLSKLIENNRSSNKIVSQWPTSLSSSNYKLGIGDTLTLTLIKQVKTESQVPPNGSETQQNVIINSKTSDETLTSKGRIGSDGSVLLLEVGRLEANGKSLNELRSEVRNILIRNGVSPRFQLEITEFKSQKAYLTVNSESKVIILNDQITTIKDILTSAEVGFSPGVITKIRLQREGKEHIISLRKIYSENAPALDVRAGDHLFVEDTSANIDTNSSIVDSKGKVVFKGIGGDAAGYSLNELRTKISNSIQNY